MVSYPSTHEVPRFSLLCTEDKMSEMYKGDGIDEEQNAPSIQGTTHQEKQCDSNEYGGGKKEEYELHES